MTNRITDLHAAQRVDDRVRDALDPARESWHMPHFNADERPFFAPLPDHHVTVWPLFRQRPHCTGACNQGRKPCVTPDACLKPAEDIDAINVKNAALISLGYVLAHPITWLAGGVIGLAALLHLAARMGWLA